MPDLAKVKVLEDAVTKMIDTLSDYEKALIYTILYRQGMNLNHAESVLRKGPG